MANLTPTQQRLLAALSERPYLSYDYGRVRVAFRDRPEAFEVPETTFYALRRKGYLTMDAQGVHLVERENVR